MNDRLRELELECERTGAECERTRAWFDKRSADFKKFLGNTRKKTKPGRPGIWRSSLGREFISAVFEYQHERACGPSRALREVSKRQKFKKLQRRGRGLEVRYQEARRYWADVNPFGAIRRNYEYQRAFADYMAASDRHIAALTEANNERQRLIRKLKAALAR
jgi:hypothetical protein